MRGAGPRRRRGRRTANLLLVVALACAGVLAVRSWRERFAERSAFPTVEGRIQLPGLAQPVSVRRDVRGIPHIRAASERDAFLALGFTHAQDRLGQMLWLRRLAEGRSAEVLGRSGLDSDRLARSIDLAGLAEAQLPQLGRVARTALEAYAEGVNARIARVEAGLTAPPALVRRTRMGLERWQPEHSLALVKLYSWSLGASVDVSLVLSELIAQLGGFEARRFFPSSGPGWAPRGPGSTAGGGLAAAPVPDPLRRAAGFAGRGIGSSAWVIGGSHTESGLPILVADAHLETTAPAALYLAHLNGGALDVAGTTMPGIPAFWSGFNRDVAWAATNARAVVTDLYRETLHPSDPTRYHDGRRWRDLEERVETIRVRGADDEVLRVRSTRHGPLVESWLSGQAEPVSVAWNGARVAGPSGIGSLLQAAHARSVEAFVEALREHREPVLAFVFADRQGSMGLQVAGWLPRRSLAPELVPLPGRARWYDWAEPIGFDTLPRARLDGGRGWTVVADQSLEVLGSEDPIEWLWRSGARTERIEALLREEAARGGVDLRAMAALQLDEGGERPRELVVRALELAAPQGELEREAAEVARILRDWDGQARASSTGAAAYHVFREALTEALLQERLGPDLMGRFLALPQVDPGQIVLEIVRDAGKAPPDSWSNRERVAASVRSSLRETWLRLSYRMGANRRKWTWGRIHVLRFRSLPGLESAMGAPRGLGPFAYGGDDTTVKAAEYDPLRPFDVRVASTVRFAVDTGTLDRALVSIAPGQSEHPGHPHFRDGVEQWLEGRPGLLVTGRLLVEEWSVATLELEPVR